MGNALSGNHLERLVIITGRRKTGREKTEKIFKQRSVKHSQFNFLRKKGKMKSCAGLLASVEFKRKKE